MATVNLGRVKPIHRGDYSPLTTYKELDMLKYQGLTYICLQEATGILPTNAAYFQPLVDSQSAQGVLDLLKTVDGVSSGLDADLLDGRDLTYFQQRIDDVQSIELGKLLTGDRNSHIDIHSSDGVDYSARLLRWNGVNGGFQLKQTGTGNIEIIGGSSLLRDGHTVWHAGNDGASSGLDADLLRGLPADFTAVKAENGYQKLPSGLIIQWGTVSYVVGTSVGDAASTVFTFPIAFPNGVLNVTVANSGIYDEFFESITASVNTSLTSTQIHSRRVIGSNAANDPLYVSILAIGY